MVKIKPGVVRGKRKTIPARHPVRVQEHGQTGVGAGEYTRLREESLRDERRARGFRSIYETLPISMLMSTYKGNRTVARNALEGP